MLKLKDLRVNYGGIEAVKGVDLEVEEGKIITLIGANGAGKSTILKSIIGLVKATKGKIIYEDRELTQLDTSDIVKMGISLVPEGRRIFSNLNVYENIKIGGYLRKDSIKEDVEWIYQLFPRLKERHWQLAGTLSGGEQQMLAVARALMSRPKLLMMDEPSLGLAPLIVNDIFGIIDKIHKQGVTILLIEQNAHLALKVADYGYVLETGKILIEGTGEQLMNNEKVEEAYLGKNKK